MSGVRKVTKYHNEIPKDWQVKEPRNTPARVPKTLCWLVQSWEGNNKTRRYLTTACTVWILQSVYGILFFYLGKQTNVISTNYSVWQSFTLTWWKSVTNISYLETWLFRYSIQKRKLSEYLFFQGKQRAYVL